MTARLRLAFVAVMVGALAQSCGAAAPVGWSKAYRYAWSGGRNAAGTGMVVSYDLTLADGSCRLVAKGYQTDQTIVCRSQPGAAGLDVYFASYGDGRTVDAYGNAEYRVGQTLFTLRKSGGRVVTAWKAFALPNDTPHPAGVYFVRRP